MEERFSPKDDIPMISSLGSFGASHDPNLEIIWLMTRCSLTYRFYNPTSSKESKIATVRSRAISILVWQCISQLAQLCLFQVLQFSSSFDGFQYHVRSDSLISKWVSPRDAKSSPRSSQGTCRRPRSCRWTPRTSRRRTSPERRRCRPRIVLVRRRSGASTCTERGIWKEKLLIIASDL